MYGIFGDLNSDDDFKGFETGTLRASESFGKVSSIHSCNLTDFSSKPKGKILVVVPYGLPVRNEKSQKYKTVEN